MDPIALGELKGMFVDYTQGPRSRQRILSLSVS